MNPSPQVELRPQRAVQISTIGATHLHRCPIQPYIPIYLIVLGASSLLSLSLTYTKSAWGDGIVFILSSSCVTLLHLFSFGWFIAGTSWVYPVYPPNYTPGAAPYCQKTTYQFAFSVTTLVWVIMTLMFVCGFCFALLTCCYTVIARGRLIPNRNTFYGTLSEEPTAGDV
ncbi:transmembrane protein 272-like isoform X4 [Siniperca chuatsi]|uniref:transmembrane protein 272-like isoform X4 n=1 Tax=Siniperca chuatsi TaxID=119488 RepID=UPI001CE1F745|nr:transmembrane protein 272-like isoform X4 [Siniperca chuatsi]